MTQEDFKARVSMAYEGREQWDAFLNRVWSIHTSELPHWISVEDELPKEYGAYLVFNSVTSTQDIYVYSNGNWWYNAFKCPSGVVTHWMPLPKMPILSNSENTGRDLKGGDQ